MVEIGSVILAEVTQIVPYGIWLQYQGEKILVRITELSWEPVRNPSEIVKLGQILEVKVKCYNYHDRVIIGSRKALQPDKNPYRQLSRLDPESILQGKVESLSGDKVLISLPGYARGHIPKARLTSELAVGQTLA